MTADEEMSVIAEELRVMLIRLNDAYGITKKKYAFRKNRGLIDYIRCALNPEKHAIARRPFEGKWCEFADFKIGYKITFFDEQTCTGFSRYVVFYKDVEVLGLDTSWGITFAHTFIKTFRKDINWYSKLVAVYKNHLAGLQAVENAKVLEVKELRQAMIDFGEIKE